MIIETFFFVFFIGDVVAILPLCVQHGAVADDLGVAVQDIQHSSWTQLFPWWRHQMETFSASLTICAGNSPVPGEFTAQRPVTRSFDVFFDLRLNKRLSKHPWGWWFETPAWSLWRHRNAQTCSFITVVSFVQFCTAHGNDIAVLCAKSQKNRQTHAHGIRCVSDRCTILHKATGVHQITCTASYMA